MTTDYVILVDDGQLEHIGVMYPSDEFMEQAKEGKLPHIKYYWKLWEAEKKAIENDTHAEFCHSQEDLDAVVWACENDNVGPLTEEQALEYLMLRCFDQDVWGSQHNVPKFRFVKQSDLPENREFRNAWKMGL